MELLVHVSAPSTRKDDERSKRQAQNYLNFETANRLPLHPLVTDLEHENEAHDGNDDFHMGMDGASSPIVFVEDTQLAISALESQIITSSLRAWFESPHKQYGRASSNNSPLAKRSSRKALEKAYSSPIQSRGNDASTTSPPDQPAGPGSPNQARSRVLQSPYVALREGQALGIGHVGSGEEHASIEKERATSSVHTPRTEKKTHSTSWTGDDIPSQLPSSYSLSDITSKGSRPSGAAPFSSAPLPTVRSAESSEALQSSGRVGAGTRSSRSSASSPSKIVPVDRPVTAEPGPMTHEPQLVPFITPSRPSPTAEALARLAELPHTIESRPPDTSLDLFTTHVTSALHSLATNPDLAGRYRPEQVVRQLRISERGHWRIDVQSWALELQIEFWVFLQRMIGNGNAGWGVWCSRDQYEQVEFPRGLGLVRVYCWGEVVEHIYLLLYVASRSKVRKVEAVWVDADEEIIVRA